MNNMNNNRVIMIGIDHGFGQIKTAHTCFKTGVTVHDKEPTFKSDLLVYEGRYYTIGEEHKTFLPDKALDQAQNLLVITGPRQHEGRQRVPGAGTEALRALPAVGDEGLPLFHVAGVLDGVLVLLDQIVVARHALDGDADLFHII